LFPMIVPYHFTLWEAASSPRTQAFLLIGTLFLLPIILVYSSWAYWVFRGKVRAEIGFETNATSPQTSKPSRAVAV
jgi:cytochrome bd ubiquinol oxidase subunit II